MPTVQSMLLIFEAYKKVGSLAQLKGQKAYIMPKERSIDIDIYLILSLQKY